MPNQLDVISVLFFCKKSLLARHTFALFERTTSYNRLKLSHLKGSGKKQRKKNKKSWLSPGIKPRATGFSHQCSNHWAMTTVNFQDLHIFPLYCWVVPLAAVSYSTDPQWCAIRTPFRCRSKTPPPPERSHNLWIEKAFIITIIKSLHTN